MNYQTLDLAIEGGLARLTLNQAAAGNPFNERFCEELSLAVNAIADSSEVRAIVLRANGKHFSVGGDVAMFSQDLDMLPKNILKWTVGLNAGVARLARINAPIIAVVQGTAMGGAVALLAGCDVVFAAESAKFGAAYSQIGFSCDAGATASLASRMGLARARRFLLLGEMLSSQEAVDCGLVDFRTPDDQLEQASNALAIRLAAGPTRAYGEIRRLMAKSQMQAFEAQLEDEAFSLAYAAKSEDAREGITAFVEKRKAVFKGR